MKQTESPLTKNIPILLLYISAFLILLLSSCSNDSAKAPLNNHLQVTDAPPAGQPVTDDGKAPSSPPGPDDTGEIGTDTEETGAEEVFAWIDSNGTTLDTRIQAPEGYSRIPSDSSELTGFIRGLPLKEDGSQVMLYNGLEKLAQDSHAAVFDLDIGDRDLQQCADSVIRIYAEYYWSVGAYERIAFHLTNGFLMEYTKWREGSRLAVNGNDVRWNKTSDYDASYDSFRRYLNMVFAYAGTLSLSKECRSIPLADMLPGDMFLYGGSPGHCVLVVDMAEDEAGNRCYLLAQGYMPAQDFHVLKNPLHPEDPWYYASEITYPLRTPQWTFEEGALVRWADFELKKADTAEVTLLVVGDNLIHTQVIDSGRQADGTYNYDHLYSNIKDEIAAADLAVVNQETILGGNAFPYTGYPSFNSPTEIGDALVNAGFDIVLHATNHTMDRGEKAVENTFAFWKKYPHITVLGIHETKEDSETIKIIEKNGIKIAMLNYTYGLNGYSVPGDRPYLVGMLNKAKMTEDIRKAEEQADITVVFPHWGTEYVYEATPKQRDLTEFFYEQGVDLIIGSHPHVVEPVEWIEYDLGHRMLVYYSLGNFMSYQKEAPRMLGGIANVVITKDSAGTYISDASITPIITHYENGPADYHYAIYKLADYTEALASIHGVSEIARNGPLTYTDTFRLADQVLGSWIK